MSVNGTALGHRVKACHALSVDRTPWRARGLLRYAVGITAPNKVSGLVWSGFNIRATTACHVYTSDYYPGPHH